MGTVALLALTAAFNPTEIAAVTVMLLLPGPDRLLLGYWLGAMITGIASGLVVVFAPKDKLDLRSAAQTTDWPAPLDLHAPPPAAAVRAEAGAPSVASPRDAGLTASLAREG